MFMLAKMQGGLAIITLLCVYLPASHSQQVTCTEQRGNCACNTAQGWVNLEGLDTKDSSRPA